MQDALGVHRHEVDVAVGAKDAAGPLTVAVRAAVGADGEPLSVCSGRVEAQDAVRVARHEVDVAIIAEDAAGPLVTVAVRAEVGADGLGGVRGRVEAQDAIGAARHEVDVAIGAEDAAGPLVTVAVRAEVGADLVSTHHHMDTAQREDVPVFSAMLAIATHSFLAGSYRSTELSPGSETC